MGRRPVNKKSSAKQFSGRAKKIHAKNHVAPLRGGIRL